MKDDAKNWKPSEPTECYGDLYTKIRKAQTDDKNDLKKYIDVKFNQVAPVWQMAIDNRSLIILLAVVVLVGFAFIIPRVF
jgi:hypothetical protein